MENEQLKNIKSFADSDLNSEAEKEFTAKELQGYFDQRRKNRYAERLEREHNIKKQHSMTGAANNASNSIMRYLLLGLLIFLSALAVYFFFIHTPKSDTDVKFAYKNELYTPVDVNVRGNLSEQQQLISSLAAAYEKKDFAAVISEYQKLKIAEAPYDLNIEQMSGIAYGSMENYDQATTIFQGILSTKESSYSNHPTVRYLLGLVFLLNDDQPNAKQILQEIKSGDYKYEEVQEILRSI